MKLLKWTFSIDYGWGCVSPSVVVEVVYFNYFKGKIIDSQKSSPAAHLLM